MKEAVVRRLVELNYQFYQTFGEAFAISRRRVQPGVLKILAEIPSHGHWLDLGCGSGSLAQVWVNQQRSGSYHGLDFSQVLLDEAQKNIRKTIIPDGLDVQFIQTDLLSSDWQASLARQNYDGIVSFAVLHHIPSAKKRTALLKQARSLLAQGGLLIHSNWEFQNSPKWLARIQPWSLVGLSDQDVEAGDTLLDWRFALVDQPESIGYRYIHQFNTQEWQDLADSTGFKISSRFSSDGQGGRLALYQVWQAV